MAIGLLSTVARAAPNTAPNATPNTPRNTVAQTAPKVAPKDVLERDIAEAADAPSPALSSTAQRLYKEASGQLVQVRTVLKTQDSQFSVGSGFIVSESGHIITNYHVVSDMALQPQRYRLRFATTDGQEGELELLDFDVRRDLALLRIKGAQSAFKGALNFRPPNLPLAKGERIYSMGNPHDVAFAVVEGNYNGLVERSMDPLIYYSGSINPGMSGGPVLDGAGRVVGVNVSAMVMAQQMSFLVPAEFASALLERSRNAKPITQAAWPQVRQQLLSYQDELTTRFLAQPWRSAQHPRYQLPVPQEAFVRCWGEGSPPDTKGLEVQRSECRMEHSIFINEELETGYLGMSHELYDGGKLGALRFAAQYSASFANEHFEGDSKDLTAPYCKEDFIDRNGLPLRAVVCMQAYRKLKGLHDLSILVVAVDAPTQGFLGRFDARGVSFANALRLSAHYLEGFGWSKKP